MVRNIVRLALFACAACADKSPTAPSEAVDGVWRIVSLQRAGQAVEAAPVAAQYQLGFENDRVFLRVDCNTCTGPFTLNGDTLTLGPTLACTRAACPTASYETAVVALLSGEHQMSSTLHNLTLSSSRGNVVLQR